MKKILMLLLLMFILPFMVVNADMGAPVIRPFDAYISNVEGTVVYDSELKKDVILEYGTEIRVIYEHYDKEKTVYASTKEEKYYIILIKDILPLKDEFILDENDQYVRKSDKIVELTVLKEDGIKMHKGPGSVYAEIGDIIPKGTKVKYQYGAGDGWFYVEYKGVKGWICELDAVVGVKENKNMLISKDLEIINEDKVVGKIPGNTMLNSFYSVDRWSWKYYITYNGISGYVSKHDVSVFYNKKDVVLKNDKVLYEVADEKSKVLVENVPANTKLEYEHFLGHNITSWIYVTYNGKTGWLYDPYEELNYNNNENISTPTDDVNGGNNSEISDNLENDDIFNNIDEEESNKDIIVDDHSFTGKQILLLCVGAAVVISLTASVTVVLVNKKNKKKEENIVNKNNDIV